MFTRVCVWQGGDKQTISTWRRANAAHAFSIGAGFRSMVTNLPTSDPLKR